MPAGEPIGFDTSSNAFYLSVNVTSGQTYYYAKFGNEQSIPGTLIGQDKPYLPAAFPSSNPTIGVHNIAR